MNELFTREALRVLARIQREPCISIFMPAHRAGPEIRQGPIRLKNLLSGVQDELIGFGMRAPDARDLTGPAEALINDGDFWRHQSDGLALFVAPDLFHAYRVPLPLAELTVVSDGFHVKPLLPLLAGDGRFFLLDLNQGRARFYEATRMNMNEVALTGMVTGIAEALKYDQQEQQLQFHTRAATAGGTERRAMFFGQGGGKDRARNDVLRFFQQLDAGLAKLLHDEKAPLVLAGVDELHPIFREASSYRHLLPQGITAHVGELNEQELHSRAWALVAPFFEKQQRAYAARYRESAGTGLTSDSIVDTLPASYYGRIEALFEARGQQLWGRFDPASNRVTVHAEREPGDEDILNTAAVQTILHDGDVYVVAPGEMPAEGRDLAAVLRY